MEQRQMTTPQRRLKLAVEQRGWQIAEVVEESLPWWAYEVWVLESTWSPAGTRLMLTFVIDPMYESGPKRGWLDRAALSRGELPGYRSDCELARMSMRHGWERDLESFVQALDTLRGERAEDTE